MGVLALVSLDPRRWLLASKRKAYHDRPVCLLRMQVGRPALLKSCTASWEGRSQAGYCS